MPSVRQRERIGALILALLAALALGAATSRPASPTLGDGVATTRIHDIQGTGHISPLAGHIVVDVPGVVTATRSNGFYLEDPEPDADDRTSEGIFVFTSSRAKPAVGDGIAVSGTVTEFRPRCPPSSCTTSATGFANLTVTEIVSPRWKRAPGLRQLPPPIVIGLGGRLPPIAAIDGNDAPTGNVEEGGTFNAATDGVDFYESLEGMRVVIHNSIAVGVRSSGTVPVLADHGTGASERTPRGGIVLRENDANPERIILAGGITPTPRVNVGDLFNDDVTGVVDYAS